VGFPKTALSAHPIKICRVTSLELSGVVEILLLSQFFSSGGRKDIIKRSRDFTTEQFKLKTLEEYRTVIGM
jgi:hypothetical protein